MLKYLPSTRLLPPVVVVLSPGHVVVLSSELSVLLVEMPEQ
jgi:hypothetical protein